MAEACQGAIVVLVNGLAALLHCGEELGWERKKKMEAESMNHFLDLVFLKLALCLWEMTGRRGPDDWSRKNC